MALPLLVPLLVVGALALTGSSRPRPTSAPAPDPEPEPERRKGGYQRETFESRPEWYAPVDDLEVIRDEITDDGRWDDRNYTDAELNAMTPRYNKTVDTIIETVKVVPVVGGILAGLFRVFAGAAKVVRAPTAEDYERARQKEQERQDKIDKRRGGR